MPGPGSEGAELVPVGGNGKVEGSQAADYLQD